MRMLHTMLRVGNLERSIKFYTEILGMKVLRQHDFPEGKFSLAFVGYGDESENTVLELTYNYGVESYDMGKAYGHIALEAVSYTHLDVYKRQLLESGADAVWIDSNCIFNQFLKVCKSWCSRTIRRS